MLRPMDRVTGFRLVRRMMPRRWKRYVGIVTVTVMVVRPDLAVQAASWFWDERARQAATVVTDTVRPPAPPPPLLDPSAGDPAHG